jgi:signal transduction histidine kinase
MLCIRLALEMIEQSLPDALEATRIQVANTRDITEKTILEVRRLIAALSPAVLEQLGLGAALRQLVTRFRQMYPCKVKLQLSRTHAVPKKVQIIVYRILQECCNNIGKHAQADSVNISVSVADKRLRLRVEDNGSGFDLSQAQSKRNSFGLAGMRERVTLLGGEFAMESWPASSPRVSRNGRVETGTIVRVMIPIERRFGEDCEEGSTEERGSATRPPRARSTKVKPVSKEPGRKDRKGK